MESFVNFSPVVVIAEKRGAGSLWLEPAARPIALASRAVESAPRRKMGRTDMREDITNRVTGIAGQRRDEAPKLPQFAVSLAGVALRSPAGAAVVFGPRVC